MGNSLGSTEPTARDWPFIFTTWTMVVGTFTTTSPHRPSFWFHSHFSGFLHPIMLSALSQPREQRRSFNKCVMSPRGFCRHWAFLIPVSARFSRRHCCRSSWRWREQEVPELCCCPGLFECGALGRGRWPTAAHPHDPPCDTPGNVG